MQLSVFCMRVRLYMDFTVYLILIYRSIISYLFYKLAEFVKLQTHLMCFIVYEWL